ncbi:MAG: hypothetical protein ACRDZ2_11325, partial [Ilumatobacteraceae bacterium]
MAEAPGPCATIVVAAPSRFDDAEHRLEVRWKNARRQLGHDGLPDEELEALDQVFAETDHDHAA